MHWLQVTPPLHLREDLLRRCVLSTVEPGRIVARNSACIETYISLFIVVHIHQYLSLQSIEVEIYGIVGPPSSSPVIGWIVLVGHNLDRKPIWLVARKHGRNTVMKMRRQVRQSSLFQR